MDYLPKAPGTIIERNDRKMEITITSVNKEKVTTQRWHFGHAEALDKLDKLRTEAKKLVAKRIAEQAAEAARLEKISRYASKSVIDEFDPLSQ